MSSTSLRTEAGVAEGAAAPDANAPVLAIPEGWVIDDLARERLARQLARAPDHILGVVARTGALPSGASYRVYAERLCLRPLSEATETSDTTVQGIAVLRPGIAFHVSGGGLEVEPGRLLVDPGAHVHDPWRQIPSIEPASPRTSPPPSDWCR